MKSINLSTIITSVILCYSCGVSKKTFEQYQSTVNQQLREFERQANANQTKQRVNQVESTVSNMEEDIQTLQSQTKDIQNRISSIDTQINTLKTNYDSIEEKLDEISSSQKNWVVEITDSNWESLIAGDKLVVMDFGAAWCMPCRMIAPIIDEVAKEYRNKIVIGKINIDENSTITSHFDIKGIPALLFFKGGKLVDRHAGTISKAALIEKINDLMRE